METNYDFGGVEIKKRKSNALLSQLRPAIVCFILLTILCGVIYPAIVTGIAKAAFPREAEGSLIESGGKAIGSSLIGQPFDDPAYFWPRPSATTPAYNASASSGSNLGPSNDALVSAVKDRIDKLRAADPNPDKGRVVPIDLVTASASGLDPHISPEAAEYQVPRVARARGMNEETVRSFVHKHTETRTFGVLGEPRVNVLELNLDLGLAPKR